MHSLYTFSFSSEGTSFECSLNYYQEKGNKDLSCTLKYTKEITPSLKVCNIYIKTCLSNLSQRCFEAPKGFRKKNLLEIFDK